MICPYLSGGGDGGGGGGFASKERVVKVAVESVQGRHVFVGSKRILVVSQRL